MLVLTRRSGETLRIGDEIKITVLAVDEEHGPIKIGIDAPQAVEVHRSEVYDRINQPKQGVTITHKRRFRDYLPG